VGDAHLARNIPGGLVSELDIIRINEIFGPTIQGEGAAAGRHCLFVRVSGCNLQCTWCDTPYTWAFDEHKASKLQLPVVFDKATNTVELEPHQVLAELGSLWDIYEKPTIIVVSGGEPMMQQEALLPLIEELNEYGNDIHIETAGTIMPEEDFDAHVTQYNVSPKLEHSGNRLGHRWKPNVLRWFADNDRAWFKFVVQSVGDFQEIDYIVKECDILPTNVMVMPEGVTSEENIKVAREVADEAIKRGYGVSFRTHVLLWGVVRGK
jgi:organic radical activating enzyme